MLEAESRASALTVSGILLARAGNENARPPDKRKPKTAKTKRRMFDMCFVNERRGFVAFRFVG